MKILSTVLTASLTELRDPNKVIKKAGNQPIAILDQNGVIGYFVPKNAVSTIEPLPIKPTQVDEFLTSELSEIDQVLNYLKDK